MYIYNVSLPYGYEAPLVSFLDKCAEICYVSQPQMCLTVSEEKKICFSSPLPRFFLYQSKVTEMLGYCAGFE